MYEKGWWGERTVHACFANNVASHPRRETVVDPLNRSEYLEGQPRRLSYAELVEEVDRAAVALHTAGLRQHDVLCTQLPNCVEQFTLYLVCALLGIVVMPAPMQYREHELEFILVHGEAVAEHSQRVIRAGPHGARTGAPDRRTAAAELLSHD